MKSNLFCFNSGQPHMVKYIKIKNQHLHFTIILI